jgi:hypothetical protein
LEENGRDNFQMSFPTADEVAVFLLHLRLTGIQRLVTEARPELTELTAVGGLPLALTIELPASPSGTYNRVVLASGRGGYMPHWLIVGSRTYDLVSSVWSFETAESQLRDVLLATYDACLAKSEIASPWRWAEPFQSTVVRVADGLARGGLDVEGVVSANRLMPDEFEGAGKPHWVPTNFGDALRIKMRWGIGTLARKATLGWVFDAKDHVVTRRVDFAQYLTGTISPSPGFATDDADLLVQAVTRAADEAEWDPGKGRISHSEISYGTHPLDAAAAWWLRELGYPSVETHAGHELGVCGPLYVVTTGKRCGLGAVKTAFADAALERKPLVMFAEGGYTRDALTWANKASVALYGIDSQSLGIHAASALATEHVPHVI